MAAMAGGAKRRRTGDIAARHRYSGRKAMILESHRHEMSSLLKSKPDLSLKELRRALGLKCSLPAIHYSLIALGLTYKKRHSGRANRTGPTLLRRAGRGVAGKRLGIRHA